MDLSSLSFLPHALSADKVLFNIELKYQDMSLYGSHFTNDPTYGFYCLVLNQSTKQNEIVWKTKTFQDVLAVVGGYQSILLSLLAVLISGYQDFSYQRSLLVKFYCQYTDENHYSKRKPDEEELIDRINNRKPLKIRYCRYLIMWFYRYCCCCLRSCC